MNVSFNANIKLLMGGSYCGGRDWNKEANDIDNCFKLYFLREGKAVINGKNGTAFITGPNLYFVNGYSIQAQECISKMVVDWIHFQPESVYFDYLLRSAPCVCDLDYGAFQSFHRQFKQYNSFFLKRMDTAKERITKLEIQAFIQLAIAHVLKLLDKHFFEDNNSISRLLPALEYIAQNYTKEVNLKQVAEVCFLSPNYFHRMFSQTFQMSPLMYIRQMRMEEAIRQLVYSNKAVKEIAYATGYDDEAYFSRTFSKIYGISPGRYRKGNLKKLP